MYIHHLSFNFIFKPEHRRFVLRCSFFILGPLFFSITSQAKELNIAIIDTGFCPNLIPPSKLITVAPVKDLTQTNNYPCDKDKLSHFRYHGHWIVDYLAKNYRPKEKVKLHLHPYIVFNNKGDQRKSYWTLAIKEIEKEKIDIAIMAVGIPVESEEIKNLSTFYNQNKSVIFMAAGQKDVRINSKVKLFPQNAKRQLLAIMLGDYYPALAKSEKALLPPMLLNTQAIDYFLKSDQYHQLRNTSLSVIQGATTALNFCSYSELKSFIKLQKCLKKISHQSQAKFDKKPLTIEVLPL